MAWLDLKVDATSGVSGPNSSSAVSGGAAFPDPAAKDTFPQTALMIVGSVVALVIVVKLLKK